MPLTKNFINVGLETYNPVMNMGGYYMYFVYLTLKVFFFGGYHLFQLIKLHWNKRKNPASLSEGGKIETKTKVKAKH